MFQNHPFFAAKTGFPDTGFYQMFDDGSKCKLTGNFMKGGVLAAARQIGIFGDSTKT
ncbi:hypothetical protein WJU16_06360 [Chitinophaga pollutisoli]|uniref:Uncharacterized protein n=1 Tax=Chitinophaga pollutisoli TaxID=3133966 RepID=A0ABZ2YSX3_9BACT